MPSSRMLSLLLWPLVSVFLSLAVAQEPTASPQAHNGPSFSQEPPHQAEFTNTSGTNVACTAAGHPTPGVTWVTMDGKPASSIAGLRDVTPEGVLVFPPFKAENYRQEVHETIYRCVASNPFGTIVSRDVRVRAVVLQNYDVHVYDVYVIAGNTAVLKCHVPSHLSRYIRVTGWVRNDTETQAETLIPSKNGRYMILPGGDLHIQNVHKKDGNAAFLCHTEHRLTNEKKTSLSSGRIFVSEAKGSVPPRIEDAPGTVQVRQGETAVLPCVAQGYPVPNAIWFAKLSKGQLLPIHIGERVQQTKSALIIENTQPSDSATYVCTVNNGIGNERQETVLTVAAPLSVQVEPKRLVGDVGKPAVFRCSISGSPVSSVTWLKNGRPLVGSREKSTATEDVLSLEALQLEDRGMYQCIVKNSLESTQASAELLFGDIAPEFTFTFGERILQPGPGVSLQCIATGMPTPQITWSLDDQPLPENERLFVEEIIDISGKVESVLNMSTVQSEDGGLYKCSATNKIGAIEHAARLNIFGPPFIRPMPKTSVVDGTNIRILCPVVGHPITSIVWEKAGRSLPFNLRQLVFPNGTLIIEEVQREADSGKYTCIARNNQGQSASEEVDVAVLVPPKITPFSFQDELLREGARARLQCVVSEGDLPLAIKWHKDGRPIPFDLGVTIRDLDEFSSILTIAVVTSRHNGNYTCVATNDAATVQHTAELSVNVPPKIVPFTFQDEHLFEGMLVRVSCVVSRGDLPLTIRWEKDGKTLNSEEGITIRNFDEYSSVLSIEALTPGHQGNYTCYASNSGATAAHSAQLVVKVPPKWIVEPADTAVLAGRNVMLHCMAEGVPDPTITWLKSEGTSPGDQHEPISDGMEFRLLHNRSLYIEEASNYHRGQYVCQATNGIGRDLSTMVFLSVNFPPAVETVHHNFSVEKGDNIHLKCIARGDQPLNFTWHVGKRVVDPVTDGRYKVNLVTMPNVTSSELIVVNADRRDAANFSCISHNPYGSDHKNISVIVKDVPETVTNLNIQSLGNRTVKLLWSHPFDGYSPITQYIIQYKHLEDPWTKDVQNLVVSSNETNTIVHGLHPATKYNFRVLGENIIGQGVPSDPVDITIAEEVPSGPPQEVEVEALDTHSIRVTWKPPLKEHWNGKLRGYYVGYKEVGASAPYSFKTLEVTEESKRNHSFRIASLKNFTKYSVVVQAYNDVGRGPASREVLTMTSEDVPRKPPQDLQCATLTSETMLVSWQPPPPKSVTGILRGYKLFYGPVYDGFDDDPAPSLELTPHENVTLEKLLKYRNYSFSVLAYTRAGEGPQTEPVYCSTLEDVPDPPADIRALRASRSSIMVSWRPPIHENGNITHYTVYAKKLDEKPEYVEIFPFEIPPDEFHYEATELFWNWKYEFWVTASTSVGEGPASKIDYGSPDGPAVPAKMAAFPEKITTAWQKDIKLSCVSVGSPVPDKNWIKDSHMVRETERVNTVATGFLMIQNAQKSDTGNYTCIIKNRFGEDRIQHSLRVLVPPDTPLLAVISKSFTIVELEWTHKGDGGQPVLGFILSYKEGEEAWKEIRFPPSTNSYSFADLQCGTTYRIQVGAYNKIGTSTPSEQALVTTNGTVPEAPDKADLIQEGIDHATLMLTAWSNENCPIKSFILEYKMKYNPLWIQVEEVLSSKDEKFIIPRLLPNMGYNLRVTANNNAGSTTVEYEFATLTRVGGTVMTEVLLVDEKKDLMTYIDMQLVIPVAAGLGGFIIVVTYLCICVAKMRNNNKRNKGRTKGKDRTPQNIPKELKEPAKNVYVSQQPGRSNVTPAPSTSGQLPSGAAPNPSSNTQEDLTPYATFQLVEQPHHQGSFNTFQQLPPVPEQQPVNTTSDIQPIPQYPRPDMADPNFAGFRSPAKELEMRNVRALPTAPPMSDTSSVTYDNQTSFRPTPIPEPRFQAGRIKGRLVSSQPGKTQQPGEGPAVPTTESTFIFPNAPEDGCIASETPEAATSDAQLNTSTS